MNDEQLRREMKYIERNNDLDALRACVAKMGEALREARPYVQGTFDQLKMSNSAHIPKDVLDKIDAALKDKP